NFRLGGELDWNAVEEAWRIGPDLAEGMEREGPVAIDLAEPVFQPMVMAAVRDWRALGTLKFSTENPDGIRPFETVLVPVPSGKHRARLVAFYEPDRLNWKDLELLDPTGESWSGQTAARLGRGVRRQRGRTQVVPSLGEWLAD